MGVRRCIVATTTLNWLADPLRHACPEVAFSQCLAILAREAVAAGFPFTAEHLHHLAAYVLDEAVLAHRDGPTCPDDDPPEADPYRC
jgi:hypothetical protein